MRELRRQARLVVGLAVLALPLVMAAAAYACAPPTYGVPVPSAVSVSPAAAPPGAAVTVSGTYFDGSSAGGMGQVEIRIGSSTGPPLATAPLSGANVSFSASDVVVPSMAPGDTFIAVTQRYADGTRGTPVSAPFTVVAPPAAVVTPPADVVTPPAAVVTPPAAGVTPKTGGITPLSAKRKLASAIAKCNHRYSAKKAKSRRANHLMARRRATCLARARAAAIVAGANMRSLDISFVGAISTLGPATYF